MHGLSRPLVVLLVLCAGCGSSVESPDAALRSYVSAIEGGDWARAYRLLDEGARHGMSASEYADYCSTNRELMVDQARALASALDEGSARVLASVPVDRLRAVELEHVDGAWYLAGGVPLSTGAETPLASMEQLAAVLDSDGVHQLLDLLGAELRARYVAEIGAIVTALADAGSSTVSVFGDHASIEVGEITIQLVREDGAWHVSNVTQPYAYDDEYYYDDW